MTDQQKGQTAWTRQMNKLGLFLKPLRAIEDVKRKHALTALGNRTQIVEENDTLASTSAWSLSGVKIGVNTSAAGLLYVRILDETPGVGEATVNLYTAVGASGLVATGNGANGATINLTASNNSGLTGSVTLATIGASETNDLHRLRVFPDFPVQARSLFDGTDDEDADLIRIYHSMCIDVFNTLAAAQDRIVIAVADFMRVSSAAFSQVGAGSSLAPFVNAAWRDDAGLITTSFSGLMDQLRKDMEDETSPAAQTIVERDLSVTTPAFDNDNDGAGAMAAPTVYPYARVGRYTMVCTEDPVGAEKFTLSVRYDSSGLVQEANRKLQVKRAYSDGPLGISSALVTRSPTLTGAADDFGVVGSWTVNGETDSNTDTGTIYLEVEESSGGGTFRINGFSDSGLLEQVFTTDYSAGTAAVAIQEVNGSGLSGTAYVGASPTDDNTGNINLNTFRLDDKITFRVNLGAGGEGVYQSLLSRFVGYYLNEAASGAETISDNAVTSGTFPPYDTTDV